PIADYHCHRRAVAACAEPPTVSRQMSQHLGLAVRCPPKYSGADPPASRHQARFADAGTRSIRHPAGVWERCRSRTDLSAQRQLPSGLQTSSHREPPSQSAVNSRCASAQRTEIKHRIIGLRFCPYATSFLSKPPTSLSVILGPSRVISLEQIL